MLSGGHADAGGQQLQCIDLGGQSGVGIGIRTLQQGKNAGRVRAGSIAPLMYRILFAGTTPTTADIERRLAPTLPR